MRNFARLSVAVAVASVAVTNPASAWWRYAKWGMSEDQLVAASAGRAVPCRPEIPICSAALAGATPRLVDETVEMVGLRGSTSFVFDAKGELVQSVVFFPNVAFEQASSLMQGIYGQTDKQAGATTRVWRDEKRGSIVAITASGSGTILSYKPLQ